MTNRGNAVNFSMEDSVDSLSGHIDQLLGRGYNHRLIDFEDHMGDRNADFRNHEISQYLLTSNKK